jgi:hypothetical protein
MITDGARHQITHFYLGAALAALRVLASIAVLVAVYYLLPSFHHTTWAEIAVLVIGLVLLIGLIAFQVHAIAQSRFPDVRAIEALAGTIPLYVLLFARTVEGCPYRGTRDTANGDHIGAPGHLLDLLAPAGNRRTG